MIRPLHRPLLLATATLLLMLLSVAAPAAAQDEQFSPAPSFDVKTWVQGKPVTLDTAGTVYVVELWATWCGPCIQAMPHLVELQKREKSGVKVVALSEEPPSTLRPFLSRHGELASLVVASDAETYRRFGVSSIPTTFLIRDKQILWSGHPNDLDPILERVKAGRWTPQSVAASRELRRRAEAYAQYFRTGGQMNAETLAEGKAIVAAGLDEPAAMNSLAWALLTEVSPERRPLPLALEIAEVANRGAKGEASYILDTYARALYLNGDRKQAVELQRKAVTLCRKERGSCGELSEVLAIYEAGRELD